MRTGIQMHGENCDNHAVLCGPHSYGRSETPKPNLHKFRSIAKHLFHGAITIDCSQSTVDGIMLSSLALSIHNHPFLGGYGMALTSYAQRISFFPRKLEVVPPPDMGREAAPDEYSVFRVGSI